jgi:uncharacterized protein YwqG
MIDKRVLDAIDHAAKNNGTPDAVVKAVVAKLLPSIRLVPYAVKDELPLGASRIGGCPDLPKGMSWPRRSDAAGEDPKDWEGFNNPLQFILQVDLAEVAPFDVVKALPKKGLLSFFFYWQPGEWDSDEAFIVFTKAVGGLRRLTAPDDLPADQRYRPLQLKPFVEWTAPSIEDAGLPPEVLDPDQPLYTQNFQHYGFFEGVEDLMAKAQGFEDNKKASGVVHRLLGHPQLIQSPGLADGTKLLLQVDSDGRGKAPATGMMWGDSGRLYYLISDNELKSPRLAATPWVLVEMC